MDSLGRRARVHAALGDPVRLAIVDELRRSDRASVELQELTGLASNLLAHHLSILEQADLITRRRSSGDGRRWYVQLQGAALDAVVVGRPIALQPALFVCTHNSARSHMAAALWQRHTGANAESAGTHPAERVHPKAVNAARRAGLDLREARPRRLSDVRHRPKLVITVCDTAHEELQVDRSWLHWSIPDPVASDTVTAFDDALEQLERRITTITTRLA